MKTIISILTVSLLTINAMAGIDDTKKGNAESSSHAFMVVKGKVVDKSTGEALAGVSVKLDDRTVAYTDFDGNFTVELTQPSAKISASLISYATAELEIKNQNKSITIELNSVE